MQVNKLIDAKLKKHVPATGIANTSMSIDMSKRSSLVDKTPISNINESARQKDEHTESPRSVKKELPSPKSAKSAENLTKTMTNLKEKESHKEIPRTKMTSKPASTLPSNEISLDQIKPND